MYLAVKLARHRLALWETVTSEISVLKSQLTVITTTQEFHRHGLRLLVSPRMLLDNPKTWGIVFSTGYF